MLSPISYERDCHEIVSTLVDHKILVGKQRDKGLEKARILWTKAYPGEPFEVELNYPVFDVPSFESIMTLLKHAVDKGSSITRFRYPIMKMRNF